MRKWTDRIAEPALPRDAGTLEHPNSLPELLHHREQGRLIEKGGCFTCYVASRKLHEVSEG